MAITIDGTSYPNAWISSLNRSVRKVSVKSFDTQAGDHVELETNVFIDYTVSLRVKNCDMATYNAIFNALSAIGLHTIGGIPHGDSTRSRRYYVKNISDACAADRDGNMSANIWGNLSFKLSAGTCE